MSLPVTPPYVFGNVTSSIPLTNLDADFATIYAAVNGIGNGTVALANVVITGGTISANISGNTTVTGNITVTNSTTTGGHYSQGALGVAFTDGIVMDYATGNGRISVGGGDGITFYTGGVANTSLGSVSSGGAWTLPADATISGLTVGKGGGATIYGTAFGYQALGNASNSGSVLAVGYQAGYSNTTGTDNTALGNYRPLYSNTTGSNNIAIGREALNINTTGGNNVAVGFQSLFNNTTASNNTAVGYQAGYATTTGAQNTFVGTQAGNNLTTGGGNIIVGAYATFSSAATSQETVISYFGVGKGANTTFIGSGGGGCYQVNNSTLWSITSDQRIKKNIVDNTQGLAKILPIQVRNFEYRLPEEITEVDPKQAIDKQGIQLGAIAQELALVVPECVKQESTGIYTVDADPLIWYLVNAVKELNAKLEAQALEIAALEAKLGA